MPSVLPRSSAPCRRFLVPLAGVHGFVGAGDGAGHGDHEAEGELGDSDRVGAGRVHHDDAAMGGGGGVDVVHAHAGAADDAQLRRVLEQGGIHLDGGAHDERVGVGQLFGQALDFVRGDALPAGLLFEEGEGGG